MLGSSGTAEGRVAGNIDGTKAWLRIALQYRLLNHLTFSNRDASLRTLSRTTRKPLCSWANCAGAKFFQHIIKPVAICSP